MSLKDVSVGGDDGWYLVCHKCGEQFIYNWSEVELDELYETVQRHISIDCGALPPRREEGEDDLGLGEE